MLECLVIMVVMFILKGVLFQRKTENRLAAIEEYEEYKKSQQKGSQPAEENEDTVEVAGEVVD